METNEHLGCILATMSTRRELVRGVLADRYQSRVKVYVRVVGNMMADQDINAITAALEMLSVGAGRIDQVTCALISAAAVEITEAEVIAKNSQQHSEPVPHLSSLFFAGGMTTAVLVDDREYREGVDHG